MAPKSDNVSNPMTYEGVAAAAAADAAAKTSSSSNNNTTSTGHAIYFPASTWDYYLKNDPKYGLSMIANRNIKKGSLVFSDSLEFLFSDVQEGDTLLLINHNEASKKSKTKVPSSVPVTPDVLLRTHGVPGYKPDPTGESGGLISWRLETPCMLMNHSCRPNVIDDSHNASKGEGYATRNIKKGEELTYEYCFQYYDHGPFFDKCLCGSKHCRGRLGGFKDLSDKYKTKFFPKASQAVQAMHKADIGTGMPVKKVQTIFPARTPTDGDVPRVVFPGPSFALAEVEMKQDDNGEWAIYALKNFKFGAKVYEYWRQDWPFGGHTPLDMVASMKLENGDLEEGTIVRVDPRTCAAKKDRSGHNQFSGFDLLAVHSCEPNLTYNDLDEDEDDDWQGAYATRDIVLGEKLSIDFNSVFWDRSESPNARECTCGAKKCVGSTMGFKHLSHEAQMERKNMTWRRVGPPYEGEDEKVAKVLGMALTPHVRASWRADEELSVDCCETVASSSSSSSDSSISSDDESSDDDSSNEE